MAMRRYWLLGFAFLAFASQAHASPESDCRQEEDLKLAISGGSALIAQEPGDAAAYVLRGDAYSASGDLTRALTDYAKAIEINPHDAETYYRRGSAYHKQNTLGRAIEDFTKAIEIDSKLHGAYYARAEIYREKGDLARALSDYDAAIAVNPRATWAYISRGAVYQAQAMPRAPPPITQGRSRSTRARRTPISRGRTSCAVWAHSKRRLPIIRV
jgi:tetratricopeptide (TPR) repeat protein